MVTNSSLAALLRDSIAARQSLLDESHEGALRLFSGFSEGFADLAIDLYASTVVLHNYAEVPEAGQTAIEASLEAVVSSLPWVRAVLVKHRNARARDQRLGVVQFGERLDDRIRELRVLYALDLRMHQDCSFYLDTRAVRTWASENLQNRTVLNAFAYTGSLGVAALGGGAARAVQLDRSKHFLDLARRSYALNHFPIHKRDFLSTDFFRETARLRREHHTFDCVFLDPPFFSSGAGAVVDQETGAGRLINKARPLVAPGGYLVAINNAVYVSGADYMSELQALSLDGYLQVDQLLDVPPDFVGMLPSPDLTPITDPAPFNHSTKIAVLRVSS